MEVKKSTKLVVGFIIVTGIIGITFNMSSPQKTSTPLSPIVTISPTPVSASQSPPIAPIDLQPSMRWYDPAVIRVGDQVNGWKVTDKQQGTYGKGSVAYTLEGEASISGTFTVNYEEATYNSNQIVFIADEDSSLALPQPLAFKGSTNRMILQISYPEEHNKLGIPGSIGRATIMINKYFSVYAEILEGVSDAAVVTQINKSEVTPPPSTEVAQADLDNALAPSQFGHEYRNRRSFSSRFA